MDAQLIITTEARLKQIVEDALGNALKDHYQEVSIQNFDTEPFGDHEWLYTVIPYPKGTIKQMSANGKIPGKIKSFGKRVLYDKATVIQGIRSGMIKSLTSEELNSRAKKQFNERLQNGCKLTNDELDQHARQVVATRIDRRKKANERKGGHTNHE
ncbi:hypothetical protein [Spirosoma flavum]|uniref:Uncharacterized protein n=1 Tax=Spirosoma flavum TaxID=2048557 RepID=A0ABW6AU85_9BACT